MDHEAPIPTTPRPPSRRRRRWHSAAHSSSRPFSSAGRELEGKSEPRNLNPAAGAAGGGWSPETTGDAQASFKFQRPGFAFCKSTFIASALGGIRPVHAQMPSRFNPKIPNQTWDAAAHSQ